MTSKLFLRAARVRPAISSEYQKRYDEEHDDKDVGQDVDDRTPDRSLLRSGANEWRVEAGDDKVWVPANENRIDDLFPGHVEHGDVSPAERDEAQLSVTGDSHRLRRDSGVLACRRIQSAAQSKKPARNR